MEVPGPNPTAEAMDVELMALRALVEAIPDPVFAKDAAGRYIVANAGLARMAGHPLAEVLGRTDEDLFDAEVASVRAAGDRLAARSDGGVTCVEMVAGGAELRAYRTTRKACRDPQGRDLGVLGFAREEAAARQEEAWSGSFLEHLPCPAVLKDDGGRYLYVNGQAEAATGLAAGRWLGRTDEDLWPEHFEAVCRHANRAVLTEGRPISFHIDFPDARGDLRSWRIVEFPVPDGDRGRRIGALAVDLTASYPGGEVEPPPAATLAAEESGRLARSVLDSLSTQVAALDETGLILTSNRSWRAFAAENGAKGPVAEGSNYLQVCESARGEDAEDAFAFARGIRDVLAGRRASFELEYPCGTATDPRWFVGRVTPLGGEGPPRAVVAHEEISGLRRADRALRNASLRLGTLHAIDRAIQSARSPEQVAAATLEHLARLVPYSSGGVAIFESPAGEARLLARAGDRPVPGPSRIPLAALDPEGMDALREGRAWPSAARLGPPDPWAEGMVSYIRLPLRLGDELIGALHLGSDRPGPFPAGELDIAREMADLLAISLRQALLFEDISAAKGHLESLSLRLMLTEEDERRRIARELHDEVGQGLTAAKLFLQGTLRNKGGPEVQAPIREAMTLIDETLRQVRDISLALRPPMLDDLGLAVALRAFVGRQAKLAGFEAEFAADEPDLRVGTDLEAACYRVAQEALTNVVRHAGAGKVRVSLGFRPGWLLLGVLDDGVGFDVDGAKARAAGGASLGLLGMEERVKILGGTLRIESSPGSGTGVHAAFPLGGAG